MPKVSIIVPCWGVEKYLAQCVYSLVNQTLKDIEIILVDDASPDLVPEMCDEWGKKDKRIKVIHKKNEGLGLACNSGLQKATGEYVAFCDSDDWVELDTYETLYNKAIESNLDVVYTSFKFVDVVGNPLKRRGLSYTYKLFSTKSEISDVMKGIIASSPSQSRERQFQASAKVALYRRNIIEANAIQFISEREIPSEDLLFNLEFLSKSTKVATLSDLFYNYRINPLSITHSVKRNAFNLSKRLRAYLSSKVEEYKLGSDGINRINRLFIAMNRSLIMRIYNSNVTTIQKSEMVNEITHDDCWKRIWESYPVNSMPLKHRFFLWAIVHNSTIFLKMLSYIANRQSIKK